ncbi:hypothetical protein [Pseudosulfitobacter sp. SM2401]|uniref:hypothetical protein n=1 Tax=Pseudosulfitobacter sp. SM2401 TaxID=3350098 RepID=UPI0036F3EE98
MGADNGTVQVKPDQTPDENNWREFFERLPASGWRCSVNNRFQAAPLGCDVYDLADLEGSEKDVLDLVMAKIRAKELVSFTLFPPKTDREMWAMYVSEYSKGTISFVTHDSYPVLEGTMVADFSRGLAWIVPICFEAFGVFELECHQYVDRESR